MSPKLTLTARSRQDYLDMIRTHWFNGLLGVLGAAEILMASSAPVAVGVVGLIGGFALIAAPWLAPRSRPLSWILLAIGVLPFTALTYWAGVPVVLALLALSIGVPLTVRARHRPRQSA